MVCLSDLWEGEGNRGELGGGGHPEAQCGPLVIAKGNADSLQFFFFICRSCCPLVCFHSVHTLSGCSLSNLQLI